MTQSARTLENAGLTRLGKDILSFERSWWSQDGAKENGIRERFDMSSTRYYQLLNELLDDEDALAHDPLLIKRLRRLREQRRRARSAARLSVHVR